jgi:hypothetical protein
MELSQEQADLDVFQLKDSFVFDGSFQNACQKLNISQYKYALSSENSHKELHLQQ